MSLAERLAFWLLPAAYTTPARLLALEPQLTPELAARLLAEPRLRHRLSRRILWQAGLPLGPPPAESPAFALARLPAAELLRLARACGALLHHPAIRAAVLREERQRLKDFLGADIYALAVKRAPFLRLPTRTAEPEALPAAIERDGLACVAARLGQGPPGLLGRVRLKLDPESGLEVPEPELAGDLGRRVIERILREGEPAWQALSS